jgi:hypothetical protein
MEIIDATNGISAVIGLLMLYNLRKLFSTNIGGNKAFSVIAFIGLGAILFSWRTGTFEAFLAGLGVVAR